MVIARTFPVKRIFDVGLDPRAGGKLHIGHPVADFERLGPRPLQFVVRRILVNAYAERVRPFDGCHGNSGEQQQQQERQKKLVVHGRCVC